MRAQLVRRSGFCWYLILALVALGMLAPLTEASAADTLVDNFELGWRSGLVASAHNASHRSPALPALRFGA